MADDRRLIAGDPVRVPSGGKQALELIERGVSKPRCEIGRRLRRAESRRLDRPLLSLYSRFTMDMVTERIRAALDRAEAEIRDLGADAFRGGDDAGAGQARDIVLALKPLRLQLNGSATRAFHPASKATGGTRKRSESNATGRKTRKVGKSKYPKFLVRNGSLVRVGWSKKNKSEYEHKAPRETFDGTVYAMAQVAKNGSGPFTAEQIIERVNDPDKSCPGYQVYVVIGLLRERKCVE